MPGQFLCFYVEMRFPSKIYKILLPSQGVSGANRGRAVSLPSPPRLHQQISSFSMVIIPSIAPFHKEPQNPLSVFTVRGSGPSGPRLESPQDAKGQKTSQGSLYQPANSGSWGLLHQTLFTLECAPEGLF